MAMFINEKTCYLIFLLTCFSFIYAMILLCLTATGALRCEINNGGCWKKTHDGVTYSACAVCCWTLNQLVIHIFISCFILLFVIKLDFWWLSRMTQKIASVRKDSRVTESTTVMVLLPLISSINRIRHHIHYKVDEVGLLKCHII